MNLLGGLSTEHVSDFWTLVREVDPGGIEREASRHLKILVCGYQDAGHRALASELISGALDGEIVDVFDLPFDVPVALPSADLYIYVVRADRLDPVQSRQHLWQLTKRSGLTLCAINDQSRSVGSNTDVDYHLAESLGITDDRILPLAVTDRKTIQTTLAARIVELAPHLALPLGRNLPTFREEAARQLIRETSRVNAEFAGVSSLPSIIPLVGGLAAAGADIVVLTKNQTMLLIKLALIHHRPIDDRWQLLAEITPVVGAAFFWRWAARALIGLIPSPLAIAPKVAIAYIGTFVVGRAAEYYYQQGRRPPPDLMEGFAREATDQFALIQPLMARLRRRFPLP